MSPCGDIAVWVQRWNGSPLMKGAGLAEIPRVSSTFPSSVHWRTVWSPSSVSQTVSSGAMNTPCARGKSPSPNERRKLPSRSNTIIGCSPRLKTKTLSVLSTPTPPISLNDQPGGSFAQFSTGSYEYAPLPTVAMPPPCSLPVGKLVTKQKVRPAQVRPTTLAEPSARPPEGPLTEVLRTTYARASSSLHDLPCLTIPPATPK